MGLAVLPARLSKEIDILCDAMVKGVDLSSIPAIAHHKDWAEQLLRDNPDINESNVRGIIENGIGEVFMQVLLDAGVYKRTPEGKAAFMRFINVIKG
jgi:UDPglucose--hexose-1-phosphate uridylyltransferase